ncbi:MAG: Csac_0668 family 2Fe-2S cluster-binding (seleno)protein [Eubacteriales bacterium]
MADDNLCPGCGKPGTAVKNVTVRHLIKGGLVESVSSNDYFLCITENCDVVYFSSEPASVFYKTDLTVPVWFKAGAAPKYICYCNQVTEGQIIDAVVNHNAKDMKDIVRLTGAMKNGQCLQNNPTGKCCGPVIQKTIDSALKKH